MTDLATSVDAIALVAASLDTVSPFDPTRPYSPKEREPYDALCDRFLRAVEVCLKYFRTYERFTEAEVSETIRDLLLRMEKQGMVSSMKLWIDMRDVRNRIFHDYLPEQLSELYGLIMGEMGQELLRVKQRIEERRV